MRVTTLLSPKSYCGPHIESGASAVSVLGRVPHVWGGQVCTYKGLRLVTRHWLVMKISVQFVRLSYIILWDILCWAFLNC